MKQEIYVDIDTVVADFPWWYGENFGNVNSVDKFTIKNNCATRPNFFRDMPDNEKGRELIMMLKDRYQVIFVSSTFAYLKECKKDKFDWICRHFDPEYFILFTDDIKKPAHDYRDVLISGDVTQILDWADAGGTSFDFIQKNQHIVDKINGIFDEDKIIQKFQKEDDAPAEAFIPTPDPFEPILKFGKRIFDDLKKYLTFFRKRCRK